MSNEPSASVNLVNTDGECASFSPEELMSRRLNSWKGWYCSAGSENIYISHDGNLYVGTCKVGGMRGNVFDGHFDLPGTWIQCDKEWCMCGHDMRLRKARRKDLIPMCSPQSIKTTNNKLKDGDWVMPYHFNAFKHFPAFITWDIGRRCNYSCHYCHPHVSNTYEAHKTWGSLHYAVDKVLDFFLDHYRVRAKWVFTGGEPTINPDFMRLVEYLFAKGHIIHTQTNASRHADYYAKLIEYSSIGISLHLEYYREDKFLNICRAVMDKMMSGNKNASEQWFEIRIMVPPRMYAMALDIKNKILGLPRFSNFRNIHFSPLYKIGGETDQMLEYDDGEYAQIIAHA